VGVKWSSNQQRYRGRARGASESVTVRISGITIPAMGDLHKLLFVVLAAAALLIIFFFAFELLPKIQPL
jgi:hypothetical protein